MRKLLVLNGPNINMTGIRQREIYGETGYDELVSMIKKWCEEAKFKADVYQSNYEGKLIDIIQKSVTKGYCAIIINPGAYSHYSIAIMDALLCVDIPKIEVHISDVQNREDFRKNLITAKACDSVISGKGYDGYRLAIDEISKLL
jgi:3-dehydroquinate dehydratase-2